MIITTLYQLLIPMFLLWVIVINNPVSRILQKSFSLNRCLRVVESYNPCPNLWDTSCFRWGNVIKVDSPPPPEQCWLLQVKHLRTSTLFRRVGKSLVRAVFMSVYCRLAANSIQNQAKKGRCPKTFWPGLSEKLHFGNHFQMLLICIFQFWLLQKCAKCFNFSMFGWIFTSSGAYTAYSLNFGMDSRSFFGFRNLHL